jgi:hypothetical protein
VIRSLVIPIDGRRPNLLRRCLLSHIRQSEIDGVALQVTVCDNSGHLETEMQTRTVLRTVATSVDARFMGCTERRRYVTHLVAELGGGDDTRAELAFALGPLAPSTTSPLLSHWPRPGSDAPARNVLQLDQVGHRYASVDDDTTSYFSTTPGASLEGWREVEYEDPTEFWFYPSAQAAFDDAPRADVAGDAGHLGVIFMGALGRDVLVAQTGLVGDAAMSPSPYLLTRHGITRANLLRDYAVARASRHVRRAVLAPTLAAHPHFMTVCCAFDGRFLLPPFLPLPRDADGLFGQVLRAVTGSLIAHTPYCVTHDPGASRPPMLSDLGASPSPAALARLVVDAWERPTEWRAATRMQLLAAHLLEWSELEPAEFEARLCELRWAQLQNQAERFEQIAALQQAPSDTPDLITDADVGFAEWRGDVREAARCRRQLIGNPFAIHPPGAHARATCAALGRLLALWPIVDNAARRLAARGLRVGIEEPPF